jgi:hypothetical protein
MIVNIVSNPWNGVGLQRDFETLSTWLTDRGHIANGLNHAGVDAPDSDLTIFDEVVNPLKMGSRNWVMPHPEWWFPEWDEHLPSFEKVLAKTKDCQRLFPGSEYIGWCSRDLLHETIERQPRFLHIAGKSQLKNTEAIMEAWRKYDLPPLTIVSDGPYRGHIRNVTFHRWLPEHELTTLMNSHQFHLLPSAYEGWGHVIHEALGVGATVLTTDAAPMNETAPAIFIPPCGTRVIRRATVYEVSPEAIAQAVLNAKPIDGARAAYEQERQDFDKRLTHLFGGS